MTSFGYLLRGRMGGDKMFYHLIIFLFNTIYFARLYRATVIGNNWKLMILKLLIRCLYLKSFCFVFQVAVESRLHCLKCDNKLGTFSWEGSVSCGCGGSMAPGFLLNLSRIDKCTMRKDVEAVLWSSNPISLAQTNALLENFIFLHENYKQK